MPSLSILSPNPPPQSQSLPSPFPSHTTVLIAGAGPVALLLALRLGQANVSTLVLERHSHLLPATRAMVYQPIVLPALRSLGILDRVKAAAFLNRDGIFWRRTDGSVLGHLRMDGKGKGEGEGDDDNEFEGTVMLGQERMARLVLSELEKYPSVEVRFGWEVCGVDQRDEMKSAKVLVRKPRDQNKRSEHDDDVIVEAEYVVGADGANSTVRRALGVPFEGFTWKGMKMIGADLYYDFIRENGYGPLNFVVDAADWAVIAYAGQDETGQGGQEYGKAAPLWRLAYSEPLELSDNKDEIMARAEARLKNFNVKGKYRLTRAEPYRLQQRCAATARIGRVIFAGDALHSNNPIGGLGLTTGILDAAAYGNALVRVIDGGEPDELLTKCANSRRDAWINATNGISVANLKRIRSMEKEDAEMRNSFFRQLNENPIFGEAIKRGMNDMAGDDFRVQG